MNTWLTEDVMAKCRSCDAEVIWAETVTGKMMPLDSEPSDKGTLVFVNGRTYLAQEKDRLLHRPLYTSHFATCPNAKEWRKE